MCIRDSLRTGYGGMANQDVLGQRQKSQGGPLPAQRGGRLGLTAAQGAFGRRKSGGVKRNRRRQSAIGRQAGRRTLTQTAQRRQRSQQRFGRGLCCGQSGRKITKDSQSLGPGAGCLGPVVQAASQKAAQSRDQQKFNQGHKVGEIRDVQRIKLSLIHI